MRQTSTVLSQTLELLELKTVLARTASLERWRRMALISSAGGVRSISMAVL